MDVEEADRVVKPVASRPTFYGFRSFSELLAGAISATPPNIRPENAVAAIRPKTVRFKSTINHELAGVSSSQTQILCTGNDCSSDKASDCKPVVVYKPLAKFVSKATVSLLANMGNFNAHNQRPPPPPPPPGLQRQEQNNHNFKSQSNSNDQQNIQVRAQKEQSMETSKISLHLFGSDRPSYDGYNWRKYGQKQVKGSEYPRSYYKCTHPNCPVKKKVERSLDGQITEIVYKGEHNHSKPRPPKRNSLGAQGTGFVAEGAPQVTIAPPWITNTNERNESVQGRLENIAQVANVALNQVEGTPDHSCGMSRECEEGSKGHGIDENETGNKKRKVENQSSVVPYEGVREPRVVVQNTTDSEIVGDGFRWRKYGQKVVKGNPHPRSYYRCTSLRCNVRKHVERASDDPRTFITTYEGKHNHEMPPRNKNAVAYE